MPQFTNIKYNLYQQQAKYMYLFLGLFCALSIFYANNLGFAIIHAVLNCSLVYLTSYFSAKDELKKYSLLSLILNSILPAAFGNFVGPQGVIWVFNVIIIFQLIFLQPSSPKQLLLITLAIVFAGIASYQQGAEQGTLISRVTVLASISFFGLNLVNNLLRSQAALGNEVTDNKLLTIQLQGVKTFQRQVLDSTNYAIIAFDLDGTITEFNKGAEHMLGYTAEEVLQQKTPLLFHIPAEIKKRTEEINNKYHASIQPGINTLVYRNKIGLPNTGEWTYLTKQNQLKKVLITFNNLKENNGRINGFIGIANDITQRKISEEKQQTAETIIANSPTVLFKWLPDEQWSTLYVSPNVLNVLGYTSIELSSGDIKYASLLKTETYNSIHKTTQIALAENKDVLNFEYQIKHKNGAYIWVEEQTYIKRNDRNEIEYFEGIITDITTRKETEIKLKESEVRYELAIKGIAAGIWDWINVEEEKVWWSPKFYELIGYENEEITPSVFAFNELLHPDDHAIRDEALALHYKTRLPFKVTYRLKNKGGLYKWYVSTGQASFDETGKPTRMIGAILEHTT